MGTSNMEKKKKKKKKRRRRRRRRRKGNTKTESIYHELYINKFQVTENTRKMLGCLGI